MDSINELYEIRERVLAAKPGRILISMGTCGVAAGARSTLQASREELANRHLDGWEIQQTGCLGLCDREPILIVEKPDEPRVVYQGVNGERARQIVANHIVNNYIVGDWVLPEDSSSFSNQLS
ncbi:MAG: (2Fe-2S) ferredoxin domain-containing protein [Desulfitobacteriaceae bacterium]